MRRLGISAAIVVCLLCFGRVAFGEEQPEGVSLCQLKNDPAAYNHKLVELTGFVSHGFEDFTLFDPTCSSSRSVWLEYGGKSASGTMYCCGVTADRHRSKELVIENIPIPLVEDDKFHEFDHLIQPPFRSDRQGAIVHATLVGRFFAGRQMNYPKRTYWGGFGHMGCCSLFAIQEIMSASPQDRDDLDYGASADQPDIGKKGCGFRFLTSPVQPASDLIDAQKLADLGQRDWVFDDPQRVATDALNQFANIKDDAITNITQKRKANGRIVYEWSPTGKAETYMIVVSRPYWLSFYARDPKRVAWVVIAAYLSSCSKDNSVTRIQ
jgi:hypothetical protein